RMRRRACRRRLGREQASLVRPSAQGYSLSVEFPAAYMLRTRIWKVIQSIAISITVRIAMEQPRGRPQVPACIGANMGPPPILAWQPAGRSGSHWASLSRAPYGRRPRLKEREIAFPAIACLPPLG